jgi:hypothetical protein
VKKQSEFYNHSVESVFCLFAPRLIGFVHGFLRIIEQIASVMDKNQFPHLPTGVFADGFGDFPGLVVSCLNHQYIAVGQKLV